MNVVLIGAQGSGKGTIGQLISKEFEIPHISTGDIFRSALKNQSVLGKKIKQYMDKAVLVPDELTFEVVKERLSMVDCFKGFVLDGFPRTLNQAKALDSVNGLSIDFVIELLIPDVISVERLSARRICSKCNVIYGLGNLSKKLGVCDSCDGKLFQRDDDKSTFIESRLKEYHKLTTPVLSFYKKKGFLYSVDATKSISEVYSSVSKVLKR